MSAKAGAPSSNLEVKFLNSQAVRPARQSGLPGNLRQPGRQASREIWACRASRAKNHAAPAGPGGRKENALAEKRKYP